MKNLKRISIIALVACVAFVQVGCFGRFALVKKLYTWNDSLGNKFAKTAVFWVFMIIPVYGIASAIDFWILNLIEFWSGSNPLAMKEGEKETQVLAWHGEQFQITVTQNRYHIEQLTGDKVGKVTELLYRESDKSWNAIAECQDVKLVSFDEKDGKEMVTFYKPDGSSYVTSTSQSIVSIQQHLSEAYAMK